MYAREIFKSRDRKSGDLFFFVSKQSTESKKFDLRWLRNGVVY